jgi:hypothetical protein
MLKGPLDAGNRPGKRPHNEIDDFGIQGSGRFHGASRGGRWSGAMGREEFGRIPPGGRMGNHTRGNFRVPPPAGRGRNWDARGPMGRYSGRGRH